MSSQKGNLSRTRPQKHKNQTAFRNNLHDKSNKLKFLNSLDITDVCDRCKAILDWKIRYKKYKISKQPRTCTKCHQKTVKMSYRVICAACAIKMKICPKCGKNEQEIKSDASQAEPSEECDSDEDKSEETE